MRKRNVCMSLMCVLALTCGYSQTTQLFAVVQKGTPLEVQAAIDGGANLNARDVGGTTPLIWAAAFNPNPEVIRTLLEAGADIDLRGTNEGMTALLAAVANNTNLEVTATLLEAGADLNARDERNGRGALIYAAKGKSNPPEVIILLLRAGLDAKAKDNMGYTALDYAEYNENLKGTDALKRLEEASR